LTFLVVSRIPLGGSPGRYCDTATAKSSNADTVQAAACICVPAFAAIQTQLVDLGDPVAAGNTVTYSTVLYNEQLSNEGVDENKLKYSFGVVNPIFIGFPGLFRDESTAVYRDPLPITDPITGLVLSDASNSTAVLMAEGVDYTVNNTVPGFQKLDLTPSWVLQPGTALYLTHLVRVPAQTPVFNMYTSGYIWNSTGTFPPGHHYLATKSEPTTVIPQ